MSPTDVVPVPDQALTPELITRLLTAARSGLFREAVAHVCGVTSEWLDTQIAMGLSPNAVEPHRSFARFYVAAEAGEQLTYVAAWQQAARVDWKAAQAWLASRYPEQWGPKATKNRQASELQPSDDDVRAEEEMVRALIKQRPPVLVRLLAEAGVDWPEPGVKSEK